MFGLRRQGTHGRFRQLLSAYLDGEVTERDRHGVEAHLETCAVCREELDGLRAVVGLLRRMPQVQPRRPFALELAPSTPRGLPAYLWLLRTATAATAAVLVGIFAADFAGLFPGDATGLGVTPVEAPAPAGMQPMVVEKEVVKEAPVELVREAVQEVLVTVEVEKEAPVQAAREAEVAVAEEKEPALEKEVVAERDAVAEREVVVEREALEEPPRGAAGNAYLLALEGSLVGLLVMVGGLTLYLARRRRRSL